MISGSTDKTARRWDQQEGKEIEEVRDVCEQRAYAVVVSKDGRWVITAGGHFNQTDRMVTCINSSTDSTLLASGSWDGTA
ncbi:hypothetical protein BDR03DRAFT_967001 [Suillus americanus]|nr:hypothetical protein BDR03DRAFT_967001 [Suillus americanus]